MKIISALVFILSLLIGSVSAAMLTNADVIKMTQANIDDAIILTAIENSEWNFDTTSQGLIDLSTAKVSKTVISTMIKIGKENTKSPVSATKLAVESAETISPSELVLLDGDQIKSMRYINPQVRTAARGLGFGGVASYAVLRGVQANERVKNAQPSFLVSVPNQAQPESYLTLASFAVRKNNSREVIIGGGYMSYSSGIHPDRIVAITTEKIADQAKAQKGFIIYKATPKSPLPAGEYAVILYTGEMQGLVSTWFTGTGNSYFDFGVDR